ncbi:MAG TPA: GDP-mannose 4,6-dehydratase [Anaerolineae bacterium]|jgi:CDP-glucose 4,6-dehydratase
MAEQSSAMDGAELNDATKFWEGRRVLVTGATGLVGSWLIKDLLAAGARVAALVRDADPQSEFIASGDALHCSIVHGPLEDFWTLERAINENEIDTVFHLGAQPIVNVAQRFPLQTFETNIRGTYNLLEACRIHQTLVKRIVVASSDKAYGEQAVLPYTEDMPLQGRHPYEVSKSCADLLAQSYRHTYALPVAIARCGNIYGGGDLNWSRIVPDTIRSLLSGRRPVIRSDGTFRRDYIYVKDVTSAYMRLAEALDKPDIAGEAFNFSPERALSVLELVAVITRMMGRTDLSPDIRNTALGEIHSQYLSAERAHKTLQWQPQYTLEAGLAETIAWYAHYLGAIDRTLIPTSISRHHD